MAIFADDFTDMMASTVTVQELKGYSDDNQPQYSSPRSYPARVNFETHNVIGKENQLVVARGTAWLDTVDTITVGDKVTLDDGSVAVLLKVNQESDENGPAYTRLDFQ